MKIASNLGMIGLVIIGGFTNLLWGVMPSGESYAVLITGDTPTGQSSSPKNWNDGVGRSSGFDEFWNDTYMIWEMLYEYGFKDENIYVLYGNGNDENTYERYDVYFQHPEIPDHHITDYPANFQDVENIFNWLANGNPSEGIPQMTEEDFLFVWTFDHGGTQGNNVSILYLMDGQIIDSDFATLVDQISYDKRVFWMQQCFSGGFIDNLENSNTIIATACGGNELAYRADNIDPDGNDTYENEIYQGNIYHHGEFNYHMVNSGMLETIIGNPLPDPDTNYDGLTSMSEIYSWENQKDSRPETPQFSDTGNNGNVIFTNIAPSTPLGFSISGDVGDNPLLQWAANTEADLDGYNIYKNEAGSGYALWRTVAENTTSTTDQSVVIGPGGKFTSDVCYRITSFDLANQESSQSRRRCKPIGSVSKNLTDTALQPLPKEFSMLNAYPNPFNPVTTIQYQLPEESRVVLKIYDLVGRKVKTLIQRSETAGYKQVIWDGNDEHGRALPSGIYLYRLDAVSKETGKQFHQTRKMVLVR